MTRYQRLIPFLALALCAPLELRGATVTLSLHTESSGATESVDVPVYYETYGDGSGKWHVGPFDWESSEGRVEDLRGVLDPDPSIFFSGTAIDTGAPSTFSFVFTMALVPLVSNPTTVQDSFSGSVTNGPAAGGVTVTAVAPPPGIPVDGDGVPEIEVYTLSDDGGLTWKNVGLDLGPTTVVPLGSSGSGVYGAYNEGPIATIAGGPWTDMRADINFGLSGGGDAFAFSGVKVLVPEPGSLVLAIALSLAGMCCMRRRIS
jgi:hypothetical protein